MGPLVTTILPVYNRVHAVSRAIDSVLAQTYRPLELIVVDDGSTDGTRDVLRRYAGDVTLLEQSHRGAYVARNLALGHARGELIAFVDSDDAWLPHKLAVQVPLFDRPEVGLVFGDARIVTTEGPTRHTTFGITAPHRGRVAADFVWGNFVPTVTAIARREALGWFEESVPLSADYVAWFRIALQHEVDYVDEIVADYTVHEQGMSFDLGRSLAARVELFSREIARAHDPKVQRTLRRLLFHLSLHLGAAVVRGRARSLRNPFRIAGRTAARTGRAGWLVAFALHHARVRGRRLFS